MNSCPSPRGECDGSVKRPSVPQRVRAVRELKSDRVFDFGSQAAKLRKKPWSNANCNKLKTVAASSKVTAYFFQFPVALLASYENTFTVSSG